MDFLWVDPLQMHECLFWCLPYLQAFSSIGNTSVVPPTLVFPIEF